MNCVTIERIMTIITKHCLIDYMNRMNGDNDTTVDAKKRTNKRLIYCHHSWMFKFPTIRTIDDYTSSSKCTIEVSPNQSIHGSTKSHKKALMKMLIIGEEAWRVNRFMEPSLGFFLPFPSFPPSHWLSIDANRPLDRPVWLLKNKKKTMNE